MVIVAAAAGPTSRRRPRITGIAGAALTIAILAASCSSLHRLDTEKLQRQLMAELKRGNDVKSVSCPSSVERKKGRTFDCTAKVKVPGAVKNVKIRVTQLDSRGRVAFEIRQ